MADLYNGVIESSSDHSESEENSMSESSSISSKQSDSSVECWENEEESKSSRNQNDSNHTIRPPNMNSDSKFDIKSEQQLAYPCLIPEEIIEPCFSYKENKKERQNLQSPKEEHKEEVNENSENYVDQYFRRLQGENLKKNFDESQSQENKKIEQALLESDLNNFSISTSQNVCHTDDKNSNGLDKLTEKLNCVTLENQVSEIKYIDHDNFEENKNKMDSNTSIESDWIKSDNLSAFDESEIAKQIGFRLTNCGLKYKIERNKFDGLRFKVVDEYEHIWLNLFVETNVLI